MEVDALYDDVVHALAGARREGRSFGLPVRDGVEFRRFEPADVLAVEELPSQPCPWLGSA